MHPALVLLVAIAIIFLLIIRLHVNAFIALITAARAEQIAGHKEIALGKDQPPQAG